MEAIAYNNQEIRFNSILQTDSTYDFSRVGFNPREMPEGHFWYLAMDFVTTLSATTEVWMLAQQITSTICPTSFPQFGEIFELWDRTITSASSFYLWMHITPYILGSNSGFKIADVVAILAYVGQIEYKWDSIYRRRVPSLEIGLMNFQ